MIAAALDALGIADAFAAVVSSDEVADGKPAPDVYLLAATRLGVAPARCLVVEDSLNGVLAARAAGMTVVLVPNAAIPPAPGAREAASVVLDATEIDQARHSTGLPQVGELTRATVSDGARERRHARPAGRTRPASGSLGRARPLPAGDGRRLVLVRALFRVRVEGRERLPAGPAVLCFNHQSWADPFVLMATLPWRPAAVLLRAEGGGHVARARNRVMMWTGTAVPFRPEQGRPHGGHPAVGGDPGCRRACVAIAGEGRIHAGEGELLPLNEGAAFFAIRSGVPLVPVADQRDELARLRAADPGPGRGADRHHGPPHREAVADLAASAGPRSTISSADYPDPVPPAPGSPWYRLTELFNEWPEGPGRSDPARRCRPRSPTER